MIGTQHLPRNQQPPHISDLSHKRLEWTLLVNFRAKNFHLVIYKNEKTGIWYEFERAGSRLDWWYQHPDHRLGKEKYRNVREIVGDLRKNGWSVN